MKRKSRKYDNDEGIFTKLKVALLSLIFPWQKGEETDIELAEEVQRNANDVLDQLTAIKLDLKKSLDGKLFTYVEDVVDPLAARIQAITKQLNPEKDEIQAFDQWINKRVKPLVEILTTRSHDRKAIEKAVVAHAVEITSKQIETDLKVINDDKMHKLNSLKISPEERKELEIRVKDALNSLIEEWESLCHPSKNLRIDRLSLWKAEVDSLRNRYYHVAMEIIDSIIPDVHQEFDLEETHENVILNFKAIEDLEFELPELLKQINQEKFYVGESHQKFYVRLLDLERESELLEQELQLTPELCERLRNIKRELLVARKLLLEFEKEE